MAGRLHCSLRNSASAIEHEFVRFHLGWEECHSTGEILATIRNFSLPETRSILNIKLWFGLVNQLAPVMATALVMKPFRDLLKRPAGKKSIFSMYQFHVRHVPGKSSASDTLSRYPLLKAYPDSEDAEQEEEMTAPVVTITVTVLNVVKGIVLDHVSETRTAASDHMYQMLTNRVRVGH